jgi:hypothetical protein
MIIAKPDKNVLKQFNLEGKVEILRGGENRTYKVNDVVLKHLNEDSIEYTNWIADLFSKIKEEGFRVSRSVKNINGSWITKDGWSAWEFVKGNHDYKNKIKDSMQAIKAFHIAIKNFPKPDFLKHSSTPYSNADSYAWKEKPGHIHPELKDLVDSLYEKRKPVAGLHDQIIHGDLNPDNILLSSILTPAIIDIAPYWRPPEFAMSVYAYWISCYRDEKELLIYFEGVKEFNQMLVRAGIRMLLVMSEFNKLHELGRYKRATEIILENLE